VPPKTTMIQEHMARDLCGPSTGADHPYEHVYLSTAVDPFTYPNRPSWLFHWCRTDCHGSPLPPLCDKTGRLSIGSSSFPNKHYQLHNHGRSAQQEIYIASKQGHAMVNRGLYPKCSGSVQGPRLYLDRYSTNELRPRYNRPFNESNVLVHFLKPWLRPPFDRCFGCNDLIKCRVVNGEILHYYSLEGSQRIASFWSETG
jgi:hypothetical protein